MSNLKKVSSSSDFSGIIQRLRFTYVLKDFDEVSHISRGIKENESLE